MFPFIWSVYNPYNNVVNGGGGGRVRDVFYFRTRILFVNNTRSSEVTRRKRQKPKKKT